VCWMWRPRFTRSAPDRRILASGRNRASILPAPLPGGDDLPGPLAASLNHFDAPALKDRKHSTRSFR
jgi:hypothetical protein